jgi:FlaG/FlaF family flagellin (archaellin)
MNNKRKYDNMESTTTDILNAGSSIYMEIDVLVGNPKKVKFTNIKAININLNKENVNLTLYSDGIMKGTVESIQNKDIRSKSINLDNLSTIYHTDQKTDTNNANNGNDDPQKKTETQSDQSPKKIIIPIDGGSEEVHYCYGCGQECNPCSQVCGRCARDGNY